MGFSTEDSWIAIVHAESDYLQPLGIGDELEIHVEVEKMGTTSFTLNYEIYKTEGAHVGRGKTIHVCIDKATREKIPVPDTLRGKLSKHARTWHIGHFNPRRKSPKRVWLQMPRVWRDCPLKKWRKTDPPLLSHPRCFKLSPGRKKFRSPENPRVNPKNDTRIYPWKILSRNWPNRRCLLGKRKSDFWSAVLSNDNQRIASA